MNKNNKIIKLIISITLIIFIAYPNLAQETFSNNDLIQFNTAESYWANRDNKTDLENALTIYQNLLTTYPSSRTLHERLTYGWFFHGKYHETTVLNKHNSWYTSTEYAMSCLNLNDNYKQASSLLLAANEITTDDLNCAAWKINTLKDYVIMINSILKPNNFINDTSTIINSASYSEAYELGHIMRLLTSQLNTLPDTNAEIWIETKKIFEELFALATKIEYLDSSTNYSSVNLFWGANYSKTRDSSTKDVDRGKTYYETAITNSPESLKNYIEYAIYYAYDNDTNLYESLLNTVINTDITKLDSAIQIENSLQQTIAKTLYDQI